MKQAHETRLRRLEQQTQPRHGGFELWLSGDTGEMIGPDGEVMTVEEFERASIRMPCGLMMDHRQQTVEPLDPEIADFLTNDRGWTA